MGVQRVSDTTVPPGGLVDELCRTVGQPDRALFESVASFEASQGFPPAA